MKALLLLFFLIGSACANNLHLIDHDSESGFALFRSGYPRSAEDIKEICALGITEIMVLSGDAEKYEKRYQEVCPELKVIYNTKQDEREALDTTFLDLFDQWIAKSKKNGTKIIFRCRCGCHRTGRLAAYYQMKYQNLNNVDAKILMKEHGKWMWFYPGLKPQVDAMYDYLQGQPCSTEPKFCLKEIE